MPKPLNYVTNVGQQARTHRRPQHPFHIRHLPFVIEPFHIAPVLPGETMQRASLQARAVTSPVENRLIGWWLEHYLFYVKLTDLDIGPSLTDMLLDANYDTSGIDDATDSHRDYFKGGTGHINYVKECLKVVTRWYFRDEGEDWDTAGTAVSIDSLTRPMAKHGATHWLDSLMLNATMEADDVSVPVTEGTPNVLMASDVINSIRTYELLHAQNLTTLSYEEWLKTYGVSVPKEVLHQPELLRYSREWTYPTNTVDPADGTASTAVSWAISERADKARFFREPGFIFGVTVARPKVYLAYQAMTGTAFLNNAFRWLPAIMKDPEVAMAQFADDALPLSLINSAAGYWLDLKDLFIHGEQFVNGTLHTAGTVTDGNNLLPAPTETVKTAVYPTATEATLRSFFIDTSGGHVEQDGIVSLDIMTTQTDTTPRTRTISL